MVRAHPILASCLLLLTASLGPSASATPLTAEDDPHFGHYVAIRHPESLSDIEGLKTPQLVGVSKRYKWRLLEPRKGEYDFALIEADLRLAEQHDKQLVVFLVDKSFSEWPALPRYLSEFQFERNEGGPDGEQFVAIHPRRWEPEYVERFVALGAALSERFDDHPHFEGIAIQETAIETDDTYTAEKYADALVNILSGIRRHQKKSQLFWYQNFFPGDEEDQQHLDKVLARLVGEKIVVGGPDILPHRVWISKHSYPLYDKYEKNFTFFGAAQDCSFRHHANDTRLDQREPVPAEGLMPLKAIHRFAVDELHASYIFWDYRTEKQAAIEFDFTDALEVIKAHPLPDNAE